MKIVESEKDQARSNSCSCSVPSPTLYRTHIWERDAALTRREGEPFAAACSPSWPRRLPHQLRQYAIGEIFERSKTSVNENQNDEADGYCPEID